jgi:hypothetical protein
MSVGATFDEGISAQNLGFKIKIALLWFTKMEEFMSLSCRSVLKILVPSK